jgi:hypothetical protein
MLGPALITEAKVPSLSPQREYTQSLLSTPVSPITPSQSISSPLSVYLVDDLIQQKSSTLSPHFFADLENSSGIMEQTISSFISKRQMAAELHRAALLK